MGCVSLVRVACFLGTYFILMPEFRICFPKSRRSRSQSQDHHPALCGLAGRDPAAGQATFRSNTVGGLRAKAAPALGVWGGVSSKEASSHPVSQLGRNPIKRSAGKRGGGNANQSFKAPPSCCFQPVSWGRAPLTHPQGLRAGLAGEVHLVMILDFLFGFCPGAFGIC